MSDKRASPPRALACLPSLSQKPRAGPALEAMEMSMTEESEDRTPGCCQTRAKGLSSPQRKAEPLSYKESTASN